MNYIRRHRAFIQTLALLLILVGSIFIVFAHAAGTSTTQPVFFYPSPYATECPVYCRMVDIDDKKVVNVVTGAWVATDPGWSNTILTPEGGGDWNAVLGGFAFYLWNEAGGDNLAILVYPTTDSGATAANTDEPIAVYGFDMSAGRPRNWRRLGLEGVR